MDLLCNILRLGVFSPHLGVSDYTIIQVSKAQAPIIGPIFNFKICNLGKRQMKSIFTMFTEN